MSVQFSTNESIILEKQIDDSTKFAQTSPDQLNFVYEIDNCVRWIQNHNFKKVCLQFPDHLLPDAAEVAKLLQDVLQQTVYILADTAYESCCIDYVAAAHIEADAIIHFGPVCFSKPAETIPCLRIFEKHPLDLNKLYEVLKPVQLKHPDVIVILDTPYVTYSSTIRQNVNNLQIITEDFSNTLNEYVIVISNNLRKILNLKLVYNFKEVHYYDPDTKILKNYAEDSRVIKRRNFLVETIKDGKTFGVIVGTVAVKNYSNVIDRIKKLIRAYGKKYYIISVGKPTVAKLANFPEIDVYVLIGCGMNEIYDSRDFYKPIVTPYDVELALNPFHGDSRFSYDFNCYATNEFEISAKDVAELTNVSLISGKVRVVDDANVVEEVASTIALKNEGTVALNTSFGAGYLSERSWKGLEQNLGQDKPDVVTEGRKGIAQGYANEKL
ncbi:hypothetical protein FQR65_LT14480 [Abscondita terminalis]|nr:hypothetical protein FQR65_LT14480 [Abscondita terminalis]